MSLALLASLEAFLHLAVYLVYLVLLRLLLFVPSFSSLNMVVTWSLKPGGEGKLQYNEQAPFKLLHLFLVFLLADANLVATADSTSEETVPLGEN